MPPRKTEATPFMGIKLLKDLNEDQSDENLKRVSDIVATPHYHDYVETFVTATEDRREVEKIKKTDYLTEAVKTLLDIANILYSKSGYNTGMTDSEYDILYDLYKEITGNDDYTVSENGDTVTHNYPTLRGTLDKIYKLTEEDVVKNKSQMTIDQWISKMERKYYDNTGRLINLRDCEVTAMPKFDGVSCVFECDNDGNIIRALTRGDVKTNEAKDISIMFPDTKFKNLGGNGPFGVKTEIMMTNEDFETLNEISPVQFKNSRSAVSSIINSKEVSPYIKYLKPIPLRYCYYGENAPEDQKIHPEAYNYPYVTCKLGELEKLHEFAFNHKTVNPGYRCDGMVIHINDVTVQEVLGRENDKQKFEVAFKYTEETAYTEVIEIKFKAGLFGRVTPVVTFKPMMMKGNLINNASLGSYGRMKKLKLRKGDTIKVTYDIIPYADFDNSDLRCVHTDNKIIEMLELCPDCSSPLEINETGELVYCNNPDCPCRVRGKILNYCKKMDIANISYATIADFYEAGYLKKIEDLYTLDKHYNRLVSITGYGEVKVSNIFDEIEKHKEVIPSVFLGSLGIESISTKTFKKILEYLTMAEIISYANDEVVGVFTSIPGIKEKTAKKIISGINENMHTINKLLEYLTILNEPRNSFDFTVAFSKVRDEELANWITDNGGLATDDLTKDANLLVVPNLQVTSSKIEKAHKYGIPIVSVYDAKDYITKNLL